MFLNRLGLACLLWLPLTAGTQWINHIPNESRFAVTLGTVNRSEADAAFRITAFNAQGLSLAVVLGSVKAGAAFARSVDNLFPNHHVAYLAVDADDALLFQAVYDPGRGRPAQLAASYRAATRWRFTQLPERGRIGLVALNHGAQKANLSLTRRDTHGKNPTHFALGTAWRQGTKQRLVLDLDDYRQTATDQLELVADQPVTLTALYLTGNGALEALPTLPLPARTATSAAPRPITVLFTNDEHGFIFGDDHGDGAAGLAALWREREDYRANSFLILSGGDLWSGPARANWSKGTAVIDVMNALGYDAAALGNHEFDFGRAVLRQRVAQAHFPLLSANLITNDGYRPDFAQPYVVKQVNGVHIGIIGLTTLETKDLAHPLRISGLNFLDYETALREVVPRVRRDGADLVLLIAHICANRLQELAPVLAELGVDLVAGGHCNHLYHGKMSGVPIVEAGAFMRHYARIDLDYDEQSGRVQTSDIELVANDSGLKDEATATLVADHRDAAEADLFRSLGFSDTGITAESTTMGRLVARAWLAAAPTADLALWHSDSIRGDLPAGTLLPAHFLAVLPGHGRLVTMVLNGRQLRAIQAGTDAVFHFGNETASGPFDPRRRYRVVTFENHHHHGPHFTAPLADPNTDLLQTTHREAVIELIEQHKPATLALEQLF